MASPHIPDLDAIHALPNPEIKFYAIIGAVMSLGAGLELAYFDVFEKATRLNQKMAASIFYSVRNTSTRRDMADAAMREALNGRPELGAWEALFNRIKSATGSSGGRDLLGHNVVKKEMTETVSPGVIRGGSGPRIVGFVILQETHYSVPQDHIQIMAGTKKPKHAEFDSLFAYCNDLVGILNDLEAFLKRP